MINGRIPAGDLVTIQGAQLTQPTAAAWALLVAAAAKVGVKIWITKGGGYRDLEAQRALEKSASGIAVARPGFQTHGWGDRVDVGSFGPKFGAEGVAREKWLLANAARFGFTREFGSKDPNHFIFKEIKVTTRTVRPDIRAVVRTGTSTTDPQVSLLDVNISKNILGWANGQKVTVDSTGVTSDDWTQIEAPSPAHPKGLWVWAGAWTDPSTSGLTDLNPVGVTKADVEQIVEDSEVRLTALIKDIPALVVTEFKKAGN